MEAREWKKSPLEVRLEAQGWEYLGNVYPYDDASLRGGQHTTRATPITDADIQAEFLSRKFREVMVTDAYDVHATQLPTHRAVYVKR